MNDDVFVEFVGEDMGRDGAAVFRRSRVFLRNAEFFRYFFLQGRFARNIDIAENDHVRNMKSYPSLEDMRDGVKGHVLMNVSHFEK